MTMLAQYESHDDHNEKRNAGLDTKMEPSIPDSITTDTRTPLIISPIEDDDPAGLVASHRRPFKKRLRQITNVKNSLHVLEETSEQEVDVDELSPSPPVLERQSASVYALSTSHRVAFEKQASSRTFSLLSPTSAPATFFDGKPSTIPVGASATSSIFWNDVLASPAKSDRKYTPEACSEKPDHTSAQKSLYPNIQSVKDIPGENEATLMMEEWMTNGAPSPTKKICHRESSICTDTASATKSTPSRATPTPEISSRRLALAAATAESSRTSYEQILTKQDSYQSGLGLSLASKKEASKRCAGGHNRRSFRFEAIPRHDQEDGLLATQSGTCDRSEHQDENVGLPHLLSTEESRRHATLEETYLKKHLPASNRQPNNFALGLYHQPVMLKKSPPTTTYPVSKPTLAPPKEFTTRARSVASASMPLHPIELPGMTSRKQPLVLTLPESGSQQDQVQTSQSCREFTTCARPQLDEPMALPFIDSRTAPPTATLRSQHRMQPCTEFTTCAWPPGPVDPITIRDIRSCKPPASQSNHAEYWVPPAENSRHNSVPMSATRMIPDGSWPNPFPNGSSSASNGRDVLTAQQKDPSSSTRLSVKLSNTRARVMTSPGDQKPPFKASSPIDDICFSPVPVNNRKPIPTQKAPRRVSDFSSTDARDLPLALEGGD